MILIKIQLETERIDGKNKKFNNIKNNPIHCTIFHIYIQILSRKYLTI